MFLFEFGLCVFVLFWVLKSEILRPTEGKCKRLDRNLGVVTAYVF
jgi:hypothetical protein